MDIGGGASSSSSPTKSARSCSKSRKLGAARMTAQFVSNDPVDAEELSALLKHYDKELGSVVPEINAIRPDAILGTSGTLENIAAMCGTGAGTGRQRSPGSSTPSGSRGWSGKLHRVRARRTARSSKDSTRSGAARSSPAPCWPTSSSAGSDSGGSTLCRAALREGILVEYISQALAGLGRPPTDPRPPPAQRPATGPAVQLAPAAQRARHVARPATVRPARQPARPRAEGARADRVRRPPARHRLAHRRQEAPPAQHVPDPARGPARLLRGRSADHRQHRPLPPQVPPKQRRPSVSPRSRPSRRKIVHVGAALLRLADGLDRSHNHVVSALRCRVRDGRINVRLETRGDPALEIWGANRKKDCSRRSSASPSRSSPPNRRPTHGLPHDPPPLPRQADHRRRHRRLGQEHAASARHALPRSRRTTPVFFTEWNSADLVKAVTKKGKKKMSLTPMTFSLLHATDFAHRLINNILPPLKAGMIVLADRYVYTAFARDVVRGCDRGWVRKVYNFAPRPDRGVLLQRPDRRQPAAASSPAATSSRTTRPAWT